MTKKDKKKNGTVDEPPESDVQNETLIATTDLEGIEEVQYTDTSYTSASFEEIFIEEPKETRKKEKKGEAKKTAVVKRSSELLLSDDGSPREEQEVEEEEQHKGKKSKKEKKGKKDEQKEPKEQIPDFPKPKNWKDMNPKERKAWQDQQVALWKAQQAEEKLAQIALAKELRIQMAKARADLAQKNKDEQDIRRDILVKTVNLFRGFEKQKMAYANKKQTRAEWQQYLKCDGLPDPRMVTQMNTYLAMWREADECDVDELDKRCSETIPMLETLEDLVANAKQFTAQQVERLNEVRLAVRQQLSDAIQCASYWLLRDIERNLKMETIKLSTFEKHFVGLRLNIWVAVKMPDRKPPPIEDELPPVELSFPSLKVSVKLPKSIDGKTLCVRAAKATIDLMSENSRSYRLPHAMPNQTEDLYTFNAKEYSEVCRMAEEQDESRKAFYAKIRDRKKELEAFIRANPFSKNEEQEQELQDLVLAEPPFMPDPRTFIAEKNAENFEKYIKSCVVKTRTGEINLRKYRICGGILNLDLLGTPPQPKRAPFEIELTTLTLPKCLESVKYQVQYRAPTAPPGVTRTPEEIEAEMKKVEAEYEKLALVNIESVEWTHLQFKESEQNLESLQVQFTPVDRETTYWRFRALEIRSCSLPEDVIWSEPPTVCQWQENRNIWTCSYVNDYKFNEDKLNVQFRTGVLWPIGLATVKYNNMPYQNWELKPDRHSQGVLITVTGMYVAVTFQCLGNSVRLIKVSVAGTNYMLDHYKKPYGVKRLLQIMKEAACDFFPDFDAHNQIEGTCSKEWICERHNYHAMAFLSRAYNFQWSRWNSQAGPRNIVMQIRESVDIKREARLDLLMVDPQRATILKCNEMSQEFSTEPLQCMKFYPDLFALNLYYGSMDARRTTFHMKYTLVETVFELLQELKLSSYS